MADDYDPSGFTPNGATELGTKALASDGPTRAEGVDVTGSPVDLLGAAAGSALAPMALRGAGAAYEAVAPTIERLIADETGHLTPSAYEQALQGLVNPAAEDSLAAKNLNQTGDILDQTKTLIRDKTTPPDILDQTKINVPQKAPVQDVYDQTQWKVQKPVKRFADGGPVEAMGGIDAGGQAMLDQLNATPPEKLPIADDQVRAPAMAAQAAPSTEQYTKVFNPDGQLVEIPTLQLNDAINSGYRPASQLEVDDHLKQQKYGSLGQQAIAGAEGAGEAATFGLSAGLEQLAGVNPEDIRARAEANPGTHALGQVAGLVGSSLIPGVGEANLLSHLGEAGATALGLGNATSLVGKIGSAAVKSAIENMAFQGTTEEVSKLLTQAPNQSAQTAITDVGLAGLLGAGAGGVFGSVAPLWSATMGKKVGGVLGAIADKAGGIEGIVSDSINKAIDTSGIKLAPEIRAAMANDPAIQAMAKTLEQSDTTKAGQGYQAAVKDFHAKMNDALVSALGKSPEELQGQARSAYEAGQDVKAALTKSLKEQIDPISEEFESVKSKFKDLPIPADAELGTKITQMAADNGWTKAPSSDEMQMINKVLKDLPLQENLEDLRRFQSNVASEANRKQLYRVGGQLRTLFRDAEDNIVTKTMGDSAPELLDKHALARGAYKDAMNTIDTLNDRLHVGNYSGPASFIKAINEMKPEDIIRRTAGRGDVEMLNLLQKRFPDVADQVRKFHLDNALDSAASRAQADEIISPKVLLSNINKMSPELRRFVLPDGAAEKLEAISTLKDQLDKVPHNFSNTARTIDKLLNYMPGSALGMASLITGHNPATGFIISGLTKYMGRDLPDAVRLSMLKFLGSDKQINANAFKAMFDYTAATMKGENALAKGVSNLFKAGKMVLPESMMPSEKDRKDLEKHLKGLQVDSKPLLDTGGDIGHYLPEHGQALAETAARVSGYLNSLRPANDRKYPLDSKPILDPIKKAQYNRALDIAQQPMVVLDAVNKGTVTSKDIIALRTMYPDLYSRMAQKITSQIIDAEHNDEPIPYQKRMSISMFMGQPLDSSMTPQSILAAQPKPHQAQPQTATQPASNPKRSIASLNKISSMYQTPGQARDARANKQ